MWVRHHLAEAAILVILETVDDKVKHPNEALITIKSAVKERQYENRFIEVLLYPSMYVSNTNNNKDLMYSCF